MVLVADRNEARAKLVAEVTGASAVGLDMASVAAALGGRPLRYALDATGSVPAILALIDLLAGGTLGLVGIAHGRLDLDPNLLVEREISLVGCHVYADELPEAVGLLPTRYPGSERSSDGAIMLGRRTEWLDQGDGVFFGLGQRMLATDQGEFAPQLADRLEKVRIVLDPDEAEPTR